MTSESTGTGRTVRRPRIALYGHDTVGLGHLRRNLTLARTLAGPPVEAVVLVVAGAPEAVLGLRDVLDDPGAARTDWRRLPTTEALREHYDEVWVHGDPAVHDLTDACHVPPGRGPSRPWRSPCGRGPAVRGGRHIVITGARSGGGSPPHE